MSFLETISAWGYDMLVPIKDIKLIFITYGEHGWEIHIKGGEEKFSLVECFAKEDTDRLDTRYEMIKSLLGVPNEKEILDIVKKGKKK